MYRANLAKYLQHPDLQEVVQALGCDERSWPGVAGAWGGRVGGGAEYKLEDQGRYGELVPWTR